MSKTILFNNVDSFPDTATALTDVEEGKVYAFNVEDMSGDSLPLNTALDEAVKEVVFVQGGKKTNVFSPVIPVDKVKINSAPYKAIVPQVTEITVPNESFERTLVTVRVTSSHHGYQPEKSFTFSRHVTGTAAEVAATIAAELNGKVNPFYVASSDGGTLTITGKGRTSFSTGLADGAKDWTRSVTEPNEGSGVYEDVHRMESEAWGTNFTQRMTLPISPESYALKNGTYAIHTLTAPTNTTPNISVANTEFEVRLAVNVASDGDAGGSIDLPVFFRQGA